MNLLTSLLGADALQSIIAKNWVDPAASVAKALQITGERRVVDASQAFSLEGPRNCWLVLSGRLDLLWNSPEGRVFLLEVPAGQLALGFDQGGATGRIIAIPAEDTEIVATTLEALDVLADTAAQQEATGSLIERWSRALQHACDLESAPAKGATSGERNDQLEVLGAQAVKTASDRLAARHTEQGVRATRAGGDARERFHSDIRTTARLLDQRQAGLAEIEGRNDAARAVLIAAGGPSEPKTVVAAETLEKSDFVEQFARANGMMSRTIALDEDWWTGDHGALLAFERHSHKPVALIDRPSGGYWIGGDRSRPVGRTEASALDVVAYCFFSGLPTRANTPWKLFKFGAFAARRDVRNIIFCLVLSGAFSLVTPIAIGQLISPIIPRADINQVAVISVLLLVVALAAAMTGIVQSLAALRIEGRMENRVQSAIWIRLLSLPAPFFRDYNAGDLANRIDSVSTMRTTLGHALSHLLTSAVGAAFSLCLMLYYDWRVSLVVVFVSLIFVAIAVTLGRSILAYNKETLDITGKLQGLVLQLVGSIGKLRVAGAEQRAFLRWLKEYRHLISTSLEQRTLNNRLIVIRKVFPYLSAIAVIATIGLQMEILFAIFREPENQHRMQAHLSTAAFISFNVALGQFTAAMFTATRGSLSLFMLHPLYMRVKPILDAKPEVRSSFGHLTSIKGTIEFRSVAFRYTDGSPLVLNDLSFVAKPGEMTAIVGPSGAGKSSVIRLLLGFEEPEAGSVRVDGNDIRFINQWDLRRFCGVVLQDGALLNGSAFDNVAAGIPASEEDVRHALQLAGLEEDLKSWPMGLNTQVGARSSVISQGQRQRLMIARAIIRKPRILILDEATSALDNVSQSFVTSNLKTMAVTQIVVAHRLSTIVGADKIVVLDDGRLVEQGSYEELVAKGGLFARLVERQKE